jgi:hypothetical protein
MGGDATDYDVSTRDRLGKSLLFDQKCSRRPKRKTPAGFPTGGSLSTRDHAFFNGRTGCVQRVFDAGVLLCHFDLGGSGRAIEPGMG